MSTSMLRGGLSFLLLLLVSITGTAESINTSDSREEDASPEVRATLVTRWDYKTAEDVRKIIKNVDDYHFNLLRFQVRGNATAFYPSKIEPWAWELTGDDVSTLGKDPGWDPLAVACREAHARGIQIYAWMNVFPAWKQPTPPPTDVRHLWYTHRDWFMQNAQGEVMWPQDWWDYWYTFVDPGVPAVKKYLHDVFLEVAENYPVDGLHYDYLRYPHEVGDWAYNATSAARFKEVHGATPGERPEAWAQWKRDQINEIVRSIYRDAGKKKPNLKIAGSVIPEWQQAHDDYCQDSRGWLSEGIIDITCPMLYMDDNDTFKSLVQDLMAHTQGRWVIPTLGAHKIDDPRLLLERIDVCRRQGALGVGLFAYSSLFPEHQPNEKAKALLAGPFAKRAQIPPMPWKMKGDDN